MKSKPTTSEKLRLLILCTSQFGYHLDTYYYCKHGRNSFDITYMGFDGSRPLLAIDGICVKSVSYRGVKIVRFFHWCWAALRECRIDYDVVFVKYFPGCSIIRFFAPTKRFVFDIRTGSIQRSPWRRWLADRLLVLEAKFFSNVTVISESLARKLRLQAGSYHVLPLGADEMARNEKRFDSLRLLYVGTLSGREIEKTILGFSQFFHRHKNDVDMSYTIAGDGYRGELVRLKKLVVNLGLEDVVEFLGFVHHAELTPYWQVCNIGISFIPINEIYDCQPATKTFEYLLAGMPVIATGTMENLRVVNRENGIIISDTVESFVDGLENIYLNRAQFHSRFIRESVGAYKWDNIVKTNLYLLLDRLYSGQARKAQDVERTFV